MSILELITNFDLLNESKFLQWVCGHIVHDSLGRRFHRINYSWSVLVDYDGHPYVYNNDDVQGRITLMRFKVSATTDKTPL